MLVRFLVPANIRHNSGGNVYNALLTQGLRSLGVTVEILAVEGSWPDASAGERRRLGGLLGAWDARADSPQADTTPGTVTLVDGLIACGAPDELEYAAAAGQDTWVLQHMPSPNHADGEGRALRAAAGVICTSLSAAASAEEKHGLPATRIALPGTDPAPVASGSSPPHIIAVAALLPNKDQLLIVAALARLQDLAWTASLVGTDDADPAYAAQVRAAIASSGMEGRVRVTGQLAGTALADEWNRTDLSILVSRAEAFGLVVTESLAHGIPVIVREGTGAVDALGLAGGFTRRLAGRTDGGRGGERDGGIYAVPGAAVGLAGSEGDAPRGNGPEDHHADVLAAVIRRWLVDESLRAGWRAAALAARERLPGWDSTARTVLEILGGSAEAVTAEGKPIATGTAGGQ
ncbi:glycosyltransferase family 4 protein [Pseudarthrobacter sp. AL07]|uniref:glycosyltransferase family 4 protein n=1 Tax=unclassified Pseudarthrobacter TaxID=2647000 RepID=UPI002499E7EB|nr:MULTISPECIES: glycosyltransferase family 4 protein [unclassified Pseudarthrobacter]MDI3194212.1 glycosyltransferase family 4 protein [Pseudarthrobacter sp. AL20]MDI3208278.1 glycosyltransferase family 4 protein [Pseudarthrobacter sp. AL07]